MLSSTIKLEYLLNTLIQSKNNSTTIDDKLYYYIYNHWYNVKYIDKLRCYII